MTPETELCKLAAKYGSDRTPCTGGHAYTPYYHELFAAKRHTIKKVLEIGIDTGRGLRMWREYFPQADIYGLDGQASLLFQEDRIRTFHCDLGIRDSIVAAAAQVGADLDVVFDDGSHVPTHQAEAARIMVPLLAPGGIYVIEDVGFPDEVASNLPFECEVIPFRLDWGIHDDRLIVIRNGGLAK